MVLSLSLRTVAISDYLALCCPDFPLKKSSDCLSGSLILYHRLGANAIFIVAAGSISFDILNDFRGNVFAGNFFDTKSR